MNVIDLEFVLSVCLLRRSPSKSSIIYHHVRRKALACNLLKSHGLHMLTFAIGGLARTTNKNLKFVLCYHGKIPLFRIQRSMVRKKNTISINFRYLSPKFFFLPTFISVERNFNGVCGGSCGRMHGINAKVNIVFFSLSSRCVKRFDIWLRPKVTESMNRFMYSFFAYVVWLFLRQIKCSSIQRLSSGDSMSFG